MNRADDDLPVLAFADATVWDDRLAAHGTAINAGVWLKLARKRGNPPPQPPGR